MALLKPSVAWSIKIDGEMVKIGTNRELAKTVIILEQTDLSTCQVQMSKGYLTIYQKTWPGSLLKNIVSLFEFTIIINMCYVSGSTLIQLLKK